MSELLANMPDPTQDEVRGEGENREKRSDHSSTGEDLADLTVNTSETELLSDIFGLDLRREGGQYKITPHNPNASFTELLNSPVPLPTPSTAPQPEVRWRHQVISFFLTFFHDTSERLCFFPSTFFFSPFFAFYPSAVSILSFKGFGDIYQSPRLIGLNLYFYL